MKNLIFIRHGKATHEPMPDIDRYLTEKGIRRTRKHANLLKTHNIYPDLIITSPAQRAYQTAEIVADIYKYPLDKILINKKFYFEPKEFVYNEILSFPNKKNTIFIVGHNPIWTEMADAFSNQGIMHLRTSGIIGIAFDTDDWTDIEIAVKKDLILIN